MPDRDVDVAALLRGLRALARHEASSPRHLARCDGCGASPADPSPVMTGRPDGVLCRRCWWRANKRQAAA